jgi:hypothetical protein
MQDKTKKKKKKKKTGEVGKELNRTNITNNKSESQHYTSYVKASEWRQVSCKKPSDNETQKDANKFKHHTTHSQLNK